MYKHQPETTVKRYKKHTKPMQYEQAVNIAKMYPELTSRQVAIIVNGQHKAIRSKLYDSGVKTNQPKRSLLKDKREQRNWSVNLKSQAMLRRPISEWGSVVNIL